MAVAFVLLALVGLVGHSCAKVVSVAEDSIIFAESGQLSDIVGGNVGAMTIFLNCDNSTRPGSIGDFETLRRCRGLEMKTKKCLIPCAAPVAMECRCPTCKDLSASMIYLTCLDLTEDETNPNYGFAVPNIKSKTKYGGACNSKEWQGGACRATLGAECNAPDSECRFYCPQDEATRTSYCETRMQEITTTRALAVRALKTMVQREVQNKRGVSQIDSKQARLALSKKFLEQALQNNENEELMLLSDLLEDNSIDWDN